MHFSRTTHKCIVTLCLVATTLCGCNRQWYRSDADDEAYCLINEKTSGECWPIPGYTIEPRPDSRMYDRYDRDFPPMPPDDPTSHQFMHRLDCQDGYGCWHANGDTPHVANPSWWELLPKTATGGVAIDSLSAMQLALTHSPLYQTELEDLYLSALNVSFQRFQFDVQGFAGLSSFFTTEGRDATGTGQSSSTFELNTFSSQGGNRLLRRQLTASGAELAVGFANSLLWEFSGNNTHNASSLIDFSIIQPLLRGAGRDVVLEDLTQAERNLLANVRAMERFRKEFYVEVITGRGAGGGPALGGPFSNGLTNSSGQGGGFLGLLQAQQNIRNQRANIAALQSSVAQLEAFFVAGRIDYFQVEFARQALYSGQSNLLTAERNLEFALDQFKLTLGLPPGIDLEISESLIEPFQLVDPEIVPLQDKITRLQQKVGQTLGRLYEQVELPDTQRSQESEELPAPGAAANQADDDKDEEAADDDAETEEDDDDEGNDFLDDPDGEDDADDGDDPLRLDADGDDDTDDDEEDSDEADDEDEDDGPSVPTLKWSEGVASTLQSIKADLASARQAIKQAASRHIEFADEDIGALQNAMRRRNRDASILREQLIERLRETRSQQKQQREQSGTNTENFATLQNENDADDEITDDDVATLLPYRPDRLQQLPIILEDTIADILKELKSSETALAEIAESIDELLEEGEGLSPEELFKQLQQKVFVQLPSELNRMAAAVLSITLVQARARTESISLPNVDLEWRSALNMAGCNRLDWMNSRASLVDTWRQIQVTANDLESQLDVIVDGSMGTVGDNGLDFRTSTGRLRMGIEFDSPITRLAERNTYRTSLIDYQRARRNYYQFEDSVSTSLRDILRRLEVNQINFELQRAAVDVAISQVELARLRLQEPPQPGATGGFGATTARDLVQALAGLLSAQNQFLSIWVSQEVLRRSLDLDLGTMQLDARGMWIDPGRRLGRRSGEPDPADRPFDDSDFSPYTGPESIDAPEPDEPATPQDLPEPPDADGPAAEAPGVLPDLEGLEQLPAPNAQPGPGLIPLPSPTPRMPLSARPGGMLDRMKQQAKIQPVTYEAPIVTDADRSNR